MTNNTATPVARITPLDIDTQVRTLFNESIVWIDQHWLQVLIALGAGAVIVLLMHAIRRWGMKLCTTTPGITWGDIAGRAVSKTGNFFIVMTAAKLVAGYAFAPAIVATTINFLFTLAAVFQAAIWAREIILGAVEKRTTSDNYHGEALSSAIGIIRLLVTFALFAIAFVVVLDNLGVNVTGLVAGLGVGGIAIGLAAQGIFADLFAALAIIFDRPFRRGDKISYDNSSGKIEAIGLKSTRIRAYSGEQRIVSNRNLLDKEILNNTLRDHIRIKLPVGIAYETPIDTVERLPAMLREIIEAAGAKPARAGFAAFGASSLDYEIEFDVEGGEWPIAHDMRDKIAIGILRRFAEEGIVIPYPTQTSYTAAPDGTLILPYPEEPEAVDAVPGRAL
jgi:small-conductance mechanosensitive channel